MREESNVMEIRIRKSELKADDQDAYNYLVRDVPGLLPCEIEEDGEEILFVFRMDDMHSFNELSREFAEYQLRFLANFRELEDVYENYRFPLDSDNIFYDSNYMPYIAVRDIREQGDDADPFLEVYKCIAAGTLNRRYDYETIRESGIEIVRKDKKVAFISECDDSDSLKAECRKRADHLHRVSAEEMVHIDRRRHEAVGILTWIVIAILILTLALTCYGTFVVLPRNRAVIRASRAYTVEDYVECIDDLASVRIEDMDSYTKYILAVSYARCEALEKEELSNVLASISIYSNEAELEYWIALGRGLYSQSQNRAMALSDDKLLIYSYMKELNHLESDVSMDGEEKQNRMNELSNAITEIGKKYTEVE